MNISINTESLKKTGYLFDKNYQQMSVDLYKKSKVFAEQGWTDLPYQKTIQDIKLKIQPFQNNFKTIVVLGIGGSMLCVQTILDALYFDQKIKVICLDNIDPFVTQKTAEQLDFSQTIFLVQTKSGGTPETMAQFFYFKELVESLNLKLEDKFIFVTDPKVGYLRQLANENNKITCLSIPSDVGGRFSVLTAMGLLIMELIGLDGQKMLEGARQTLENQKDLAVELANIQVEMYKEGIDQNVLMPYSSRLAGIAKWYIQLLSESIGKEIDLDGKKVNHGITPIPAVGATDQHSQAQLFKEGPNTKLIILIKVEDHQLYPVIAQNLPDKFAYLREKTFNQLIDAELEGTIQSLNESQKPNLTITMPKVDEHYLGQIFMMFELSVAYIGEMLNLNTFDQPGVERAKILAEQILGHN
jgi:glucose-6-phosphate isomerase